eukprot:CAMPEP_0173122772 /NCGR_PEP_ID=MMETSP1102-20130122/54427_1 /TAXON_ID=49646 /ORGANISM="Geminigera sp., Strain Caron Lab Isolate" /LENGTH=39 /DNA_ID= /DNA_START= /DNA_END= /DNA_ORIENTATION=
MAKQPAASSTKSPLSPCVSPKHMKADTRADMEARICATT